LEIENAQQELASAQSVYTQAEELIKSLQDQIEQLSSENQRLSEQADSLRLQGATEDTHLLRIAELERELKALKDDSSTQTLLQDKDTQISNLNKQRDQLREELEKVERTLSEIRKNNERGERAEKKLEEVY
jgi:chromosome segregation ATPase